MHKNNTQGQINGSWGPWTIKAWNLPSITENLGYDNFFYYYKYKDSLLLILEKQMSQ
jgi:hypothetical protein